MACVEFCPRRARIGEASGGEDKVESREND